VRGQVELARATLNTVRQQLTSGAQTRPGEGPPRTNPVPRPSVPKLTPEPTALARRQVEEEVEPTLNDLRAAVDALKRPRSVEPSRAFGETHEAGLEGHIEQAGEAPEVSSGTISAATPSASTNTGQHSATD